MIWKPSGSVEPERSDSSTECVGTVLSSAYEWWAERLVGEWWAERLNVKSVFLLSATGSLTEEASIAGKYVVGPGSLERDYEELS